MDGSVPTCRKFQLAAGGHDRQENEHALVADATLVASAVPEARSRYATTYLHHYHG